MPPASRPDREFVFGQPRDGRKGNNEELSVHQLRLCAASVAVGHRACRDRAKGGILFHTDGEHDILSDSLRVLEINLGTRI